MAKKAEPQVIRRISGFKIIRKKGKEGVEVQHEHSYVDAHGSIVKVQNPGQFHNVRPHPDLMKLWGELSVHYAVLMERETLGEETFDNAAEVERLVDRFPISSIQWKNGKQYSGVQIHGYTKLSTGHPANSLTRLVKFDDGETEQYPMWEHLESLAAELNKEVDLLIGGKHAKPAHQSITDPDQQGGDGDEGDDPE